MVFFTCNACGQAVKKNQVEKHYQTQCRNCTVLSCIDCGKDFWGDNYKTHTKCITEDQKYGGKDYKPKPNAYKGEAKQDMWIQHIQQTIATTNVSPGLSDLLEQLIGFSNIPRKKIKFENFLKNSVRVKDKRLIPKAWEIFSKAHEKQVEEKSKSGKEVVSQENSQEKEASKGSTDENRKKCQSETEKKVTSITEPTHSSSENHRKKKKSKKIKQRDEDENQMQKKMFTEEVENFNISGSQQAEKEDKDKKKKNKKRKYEDKDDKDQEVPQRKKKMFSEINQENSNNEEIKGEQNGIDDSQNAGKKKFKWEKVIKEILKQAPDNELSIKKLRKKVLAEYEACGGENKPLSDNEVRAKFEKKISHNPKLKVHKERVKYLT
ncbi:cell growth-regulating nucleolar protein-like [Limulus polyphemus]|uniref:Cell growth-regulating nucleolar protein-like n=1 Tax=Limulus polyphemus TaxID=6850 RepID=A0ABM1S903_LIMPO|nr:cell growth-regulating nucleolar protein-like [Limulus polyphemus]XP_013773190.1 cell growth-regulating nucleolar protein-like [Limulus polyphemus]XP_013773191.1 cell growth-regulating nucleolar protein-like [Limulus polyphemus]XP_022240106.1 cell growth-regulating nucleolar protein-like [Limulus polyphemus]XP_022240108.1 cell growth-regulating nucleolar protein-like [Limulus polyphemus]